MAAPGGTCASWQEQGTRNGLFSAAKCVFHMGMSQVEERDAVLLWREQNQRKKDTALKMKQYNALHSTEKGWGRAGLSRHKLHLLRAHSATFYKLNWEPKWTVPAKLKLTVHMLWRVQKEDQIWLKCWQVFLKFYYEQSRDEGKCRHQTKLIKRIITAFQNDQRYSRNHFASDTETSKPKVYMYYQTNNLSDTNTHPCT